MMNHNILKNLLKFKFSTHSLERLARSEITENQAVKDMKRHLWAMRKERGNEIYRIIGDYAEYVLTEQFVIITILPRMTRAERKKNFKTKVFGREYMNMSKEDVNSMIFKTLKTNY